MEGVERWLTGGVREKDTASVGHRRGFGGSAAVGVSGAGYGAGGAGRGARVIAVCSDCIMQSLQSAITSTSERGGTGEIGRWCTAGSGLPAD